jgi:hypothetical protein
MPIGRGLRRIIDPQSASGAQEMVEQFPTDCAPQVVWHDDE